MPRHILMADDDIESQQILLDVIEVNFTDAKVDKVTNPKRLYDLLNEKGDTYYVLLIDYSLDDIGTQENGYTFLSTHFPHLVAKTIFINDTGSPLPRSSLPKDALVIDRPFSLDGFNEVLNQYNER